MAAPLPRARRSATTRRRRPSPCATANTGPMSITARSTRPCRDKRRIDHIGRAVELIDAGAVARRQPAPPAARSRPQRRRSAQRPPCAKKAPRRSADGRDAAKPRKKAGQAKTKAPGSPPPAIGEPDSPNTTDKSAPRSQENYRPTRDETSHPPATARLIATIPANAGKREIARAFGSRRARLPLKAMLKELANEGLVERSASG